VIVDLSQGDPDIQEFYRKDLRRYLHGSMRRFIEARPNNFIQFYFEEAHTFSRKKRIRI